MNVKRGKILVVSAPSGAGKSTLIKRIIGDFNSIVFSVSATTRKPREGECNGREYFFLTKEEFEKRIERGDFLEWERVYDYYYGTLKSEVERVLSEGKNLLLEVEVKGAMSIKQEYPEAALIFIAPPDIETLLERLSKRKTESPEDLKKRIERAKMEMSYIDNFENRVYNDNVDTAAKELKRIIKKIIME